MNDCGAFVDHLMALADEVRAPPSRTARRCLARRLIEEFVPAFVVGGIDVRRIMAPGVPPEVQPEDDRWTVDGFHPRLTAGGQGHEALRHVAAAAAVTLIGRHPLVWAATLVDWLQGFGRGRRRESTAEVEGNRTGADVGRTLRAYLDGALSRELARRRLTELLCADV